MTMSPSPQLRLSPAPVNRSPTSSPLPSFFIVMETETLREKERRKSVRNVICAPKLVFSAQLPGNSTLVREVNFETFLKKLFPLIVWVQFSSVTQLCLTL